MPSDKSPEMEYKQRLDIQKERIAAQDRLHRRAGNLKLATLAAGIAMIGISFSRRWFSPYWILVAAVLFVVLAVWHELVLRAQARAAAALEFYERGLARIEDRWPGTGETGERFLDPKHLYAGDLDIFGRGGLFELLSTARTPMGEEQLAAWLLAPSPLDAILERHELIAELRENLDLREDVFVLSNHLKGDLNTEGLASWAEAAGDPLLANSLLRWLAVIIVFAAVGTGFAWFATGNILPFLGVLAFEALALAILRKRALNLIEKVGASSGGLYLFSGVLGRIERESFTSKRLRELRATLVPDESGAAASHAIHRLANIVNWIDARESLGAKVAELPLLYSLQVAMASETWRQRFGRRVRGWENAAAEVEALLSLACYAFEHPADVLPEFVGTTGAGDSGALFEGEEIGHPLIPAARCVRNSVRLGGNPRILIVSGSNMSGKSTLLRSVGINTVLAMAGAPVRCRSLRLTPVLLGSCIRRTDSLQEGRSGFYTEILRIREIISITRGEGPLLFLMDELLEGTNSHDRCAGAEGLIRALVGQRAIGIITTHDLALTEIAVRLGGAVRNMHFEDQIQCDEMHFDYKLRDGVVTKSNALELMRRMGLNV